ncbi:MAG TPA: Na/Pi cotransporter, partial [Lachnospiraceae bacterium]|nr:Na/Pi cotransporter [Lachnospiraceae bacterium]
GMSLMSQGLKLAAGNKLRSILEHATANRFVAVCVGILVTLLVQSSSATDMMVISFVNSGLMTLSQAIGVIMGANIGTTVTAQITAFNLSDYAPFILFVGAVLYLFVKKNGVKYTGAIILGFGMLFFGISVIKSAIVPLSRSAAFISFLSTLENPAAAVLFGVLFTAMLQSSSSSVVIFQTFTVEGLISYDMTVYLVIGAAIGSVTPNLLASLTTNRNGKRSAVLNLLFNLVRAALMLILVTVFPVFPKMIQNLTPGDVGHQVANTHTIFSILAVIIEFPFANQIIALSKKVVPIMPDESRSVEDRKLRYLVQTEDLPSSVAIQQAKLELLRMGGLARECLDTAIRCFFSQNERLAQSVAEIEETIDILTDKIQDRLISLRSNEYPPDDANRLSQLLLVASDIERISDYAENIAEYAVTCKTQKAVMSDTAIGELQDMGDAALKSIDYSLLIFESENADTLSKADLLEQHVDDLQTNCINAHIQRLMNEICHPVAGVIFTDMVSDLERCSDHAVNIAHALIDHTDHVEH